jgi:ubiquinol-cytochrome c reductase cytochrome c1 subunit
MPPPLTQDGQVTYADGQPPATKVQMAKDVVAFLSWAAEPKMEERKRIGFGVMVFLIALAGILFAAYRKVWADKH